MLIQRLQGDIEKEQGVYYEFDIHSRPIGVGGMGKVYLGVMVVEATGKKTPVAIKAMYEDLPEHIIERAKRESSIKIKHENLVEMMGFVEKTDYNSVGGSVKHYHVISEYINGVSLYDILQGKTKNQFGVELDAAKNLYDEYRTDQLKVSKKIIGQVLSAILSLHDNGYIHRDIDPSNIMITAKGTIKLIDFGIAKRLSSLGSQDKMLTSAGVFMGKAQYAAPELVMGDVRHQDVTTDIYSIGVLFYQLLVGSLPFDGPISEILDAQLHKKINVKNIGNTYCRAIVKRATEKKQTERYRSAAEFRVAIDKINDNNKPNKNILKRVCISVLLVLVIVAALFSIRFFSVNNRNEIYYEIVSIYGIDRYDYEGLMDIADTYRNNGKLSRDFENKGSELIDRIGEVFLLANDDGITDKDKIAIILYSELVDICPDNSLVERCKIELDNLMPVPKIKVRTPIDSEITSIYGISSFDYRQLLKLANTYYTKGTVSDDYVKKGEKLLKSEHGKLCDTPTTYSNTKVAFILYSELVRISKKNNDRLLSKEIYKYLKEIEKTTF